MQRDGSAHDMAILSVSSGCLDRITERYSKTIQGAPPRYVDPLGS
jgi:hypothetical protein